MQSFRAYRAFGKQAKAQYDRDRERAEALERGNAENDLAATHRGTSIDTDLTPDSRDSEKAELPAHSSGDTDQEDGDVREAHRTETAQTVQSIGTRMGHVLTGIEVRQLSKQLTRTRTRARAKKNGEAPPMNEDGEETETVFVVGYESANDPMNPHNWSYASRISATLLIASIGFVVGFASSVDSAALKQASEEFGVSEVTEALATGLFLMGFGTGALFAGPISETVGRNPVYIVTLFVYMIWLSKFSFDPDLR
jgi:hypothetical protein